MELTEISPGQEARIRLLRARITTAEALVGLAAIFCFAIAIYMKLTA